MKCNSNKICLFLVFMIASIIVEAQHITYAEFMKLNRMVRVSEINDFLLAKGYKFAGSSEKDVVWSRGCEIISFNNGDLRWSHPKGKNSSYTIYEKTTYGRIFYTKSKFTVDSFVKAAKTEGFKYVNECIHDDCISSNYKKIGKNGEALFLIIFTYKTYFCIIYNQF